MVLLALIAAVAWLIWSGRVGTSATAQRVQSWELALQPAQAPVELPEPASSPCTACDEIVERETRALREDWESFQSHHEQRMLSIEIRQQDLLLAVERLRTEMVQVAQPATPEPAQGPASVQESAPPAPRIRAMAIWTLAGVDRVLVFSESGPIGQDKLELLLSEGDRIGDWEVLRVYPERHSLVVRHKSSDRVLSFVVEETWE